MRNRFLLALAFLFIVGTASDIAFAVTVREDNPTGNTGALKGQIQTAGSYDAHSANGTRVVNDLQVPGALGDYGLDFTRYWNSVHNDYDDDEADWSQDFGMSGWRHSWHWTANEGHQGPQPIPGTNEETNVYTTSITITFPDGHTTKYKIVRCGPGTWQCTPNPTFGPPYNQSEIEMSWPNGGLGVHDHLTQMAADGSGFRLSLADGGSVHFTGGPGNYKATKVFDPHGFYTDLHYDANGRLDRVTQEGGRFLKLHWEWFGNGGWVITRVDTSDSPGSPHVTYGYTYASGFFVLAAANYENDSGPGQNAAATYTYGLCFTGDEPCSGANRSSFPMLKRADDPHYAGPMTRIRYDFRGGGCPPPPLNPEFALEYVPAQPWAISAEKFDKGGPISRFVLACESGERWEFNGLGGQRKFYFGRPAHTWEGTGFTCRGYQLGKITDFTALSQVPEGLPCPAGLPCHRQNYFFGDPRQIWDGRNIRTEGIVDPGDESGSPSQIHYVDGSSSSYDRLTESGSDALHPTRMYNYNKRWLFRKTDENIKTTAYYRDSRRRIKRIVYPGGSEETYEYDNNNPDGLNQVTKHTLPSGAIETSVYDPNTHLLMQEYNSVDLAISGQDYKEYTYYGPANHPEWTGLVATMTDGRARASGAQFTARMTYNGRHQVTSVEYASVPGGSAHPTVLYEYDKYGNCTAITDELGHRSTFKYDNFRRCFSYTEPLNAPAWDGNGTVASRTWNWFYDRVIDGVGLRPPYAHTSKEWRIQIEPAFNGSGHRRATARTFDVNNRVTSEQTGLIQLPSAPLGTLQTASDSGTHRFFYDENGQKSRSIDPLDRETTYGYDSRNRLETTTEPKRLNQPTNPVTRIKYDVAGNKERITFPDTRFQRWESYDGFGQARRFIDERGNPTDLTYKWGPMKKLESVRTYRQMDNGAGTETQLTAFEYDGMGRLEWTFFPDTSSEQNAYELGQLSAFKTRKNQTKRLHYDARGREDYHTWDAGAAPGTNRVWDDANRLTSIANVWSTIQYGYDEGDQAKWERSNVVGSNGPVQVNYLRYPSGEVSQITYPGGWTVVNRFYRARGQLSSVGWGSGSTAYAYLRDGTVDYQARSNNVTTKYGYDGRGMIGSVQHRVGDDTTGYDLARRDYLRDDRDRILAWKRGFGQFYNLMEDGRGNRYRYDDEGQLDRASYRAVLDSEWNASDARRADIFTYDELGNRMGSNYLASRGTLDFTRDNNGLNQYSGWWPYSVVRYDDDVGGIWGSPHAANGVLMEEGYITAGFNALNQPTGIWSKAYLNTSNWMYFGYDPLGRCVKRWVAPYGAASTNATYYYYDGWNLIQEGQSGSVDRVYVHGGRVDEIVASWGYGQWYHHHYDAQGNCTMLTNTSGSIQEQYDYDAFGLPYIYQADGTPVLLTLGSPAGNRFLFTGREWIKDLRLYDYRMRMYQPELGRFLQPDPKHFEAGDYNLYRYCHNDPVNHSDPTGLYVSGLTSWGGGDWRSGLLGIPNRDKDLINQARLRDFLYSDKVANAARDAARASHSTRVEHGAAFGNKGPNDIALGPTTASTDDPERNVGGRRGVFNTTDFSRKPLPDGYKLRGGVWGLVRHQKDWPAGDKYEFWKNQMSGVLGIPAQTGASSDQPTVHVYEYIPGSPAPPWH